jgi:hypothetical protein
MERGSRCLQVTGDEGNDPNKGPVFFTSQATFVIFGNSLSFDGFVILRIPPNFIFLDTGFETNTNQQKPTRNKLYCPFHILYV